MKISKNKIMIAMGRKMMSLNDLSSASGVPMTTIKNAYARKSCRPLTVGKLANALNVDITELLESE